MKIVYPSFNQYNIIAGNYYICDKNIDKSIRKMIIIN